MELSVCVSLRVSVAVHSGTAILAVLVHRLEACATSLLGCGVWPEM